MPITPAQAAAQKQVTEEPDYAEIVETIDRILSEGGRYIFLGMDMNLAPRVIKAYTEVGWTVVTSGHSGLRFS